MRLIRLMILIGAAGGFFAAAGTAVSQGSPYAGASLPGQGVFEAATSTSDSYNWSGYVADRGTYTALSATWMVPTATTQASLAADATWIGVGGVDSEDLIQAGTQTLVQNDGETQYEAWYETLPHSSEAVPLDVSAGDQVEVALTYVGDDVWHVSFVNNTTGKSYAVDVSYDSTFSSAEWVQEMPSAARGGRLIPLDDFGSLTFSSASTVVNGRADTLLEADAQPLRMINASGDALATPSTLSQNGFTVMRTDASADVAARSQHVRVTYIQF